MKLIARHQVFFAPGKAAQPGQVFEIADDSAERLIAAGAAEAYVAPEVVATAQPAGKKGKAAADAEL